jgi:hypothetical protein
LKSSPFFGLDRPCGAPNAPCSMVFFVSSKYLQLVRRCKLHGAAKYIDKRKCTFYIRHDKTASYRTCFDLLKAISDSFTSVPGFAGFQKERTEKS